MIFEGAAIMGPEYVARMTGLGRWSDKHGQRLTFAALSALELMRDESRIKSFVFLVEIVLERDTSRASNSDTRFSAKKVEARCVSTSDLLDVCRAASPDGMDRVMHSGLLSIYVVDHKLPWPWVLPVSLEDVDLKAAPYDTFWLQHLRHDLTTCADGKACGCQQFRRKERRRRKQKS
ncbi:hypothetical protein HGRIS_013935 [Hohenbuehelia grisea]|uniref:Uncharacterized protein n=1 Tax=Hohenbuehelia grisea TaxID=104357 RepID=A0ABR3JRW0_9AGAR